MSGVGNVFWNDREGRLRAGWRVVAMLVAWFVGYLGITLAMSVVPSGVVRGLVSTALTLAWTAVLVRVFARFVDRRDVTAFGLRPDGRWWRQLLVGVVLMTVALLGVLLAVRAAGLATVEDPSTRGPALLIVGVAVAAATAVNEEFIFRGHLLRNTAEGARAAGATPLRALLVGYAVSAVLFALLHSGYGAGVGGFARFLVSALAYTAAFVLTGSLALPIGMHLAHNTLVYALEVDAEGPGWALSIAYFVVALGLILLYTRREPRSEHLAWLTGYVPRGRRRGGATRPEPAGPPPA